jgi:hypothetical protein
VAVGDYEDRYFAEVDLATEPGTRISAKAKEYVRYWQSGREQAQFDVFPYVIWIAPDTSRAEFLIDVLGRLPPEHWHIFMVTTAEEAALRIVSGAAESIKQRKEVNR